MLATDSAASDLECTPAMEAGCEEVPSWLSSVMDELDSKMRSKNGLAGFAVPVLPEAIEADSAVDNSGVTFTLR